MRRPVASGTFYESDFHQLEQQIKQCFRHKKGPGELPISRREGIIKAVVCPHAGYFYSGPCAAWSYKAVAESKFPDCYIIIGPNHSGTNSSVSLEEWQTPIGNIRVDEELGKAVCKNTKLEDSPQAHKNEHSIEVQLPFLQFVSKDKLEDLRILPISLGQQVAIPELALDIKETIIDLDKDVVFIISSDFTHYGATYSYIPFSSNIKENLYSLDKTAIQKLTELDYEGFSNYLAAKQATICGKNPLKLMLRLLNVKGELLQYYTSSDIQGDYRTAVGYASIVYE